MLFLEQLKKILEHMNNYSDSSSSETFNAATNTTRFSLSPNSLNEWSEFFFNKIIEIFTPILEPVPVNYSNELLATQIYGLSVLLFMLSVLVIILLLVLFINIIIVINSDKLLRFFTNKYIILYIRYNTKMISLEVTFLSLSLLYFMYNLSCGIHFIATHPIK